MIRALPYFSVIVATYNRAAWLPRCLSSVLEQDFAEFEIIVVDDGSRDDTQRRLAQYGDPRLHPMQHARNRGVGAARNTGLDVARGLWVLFLDSDDELVPGALARLRVLTTIASLDIDALWFRSRLDDGRISPNRLPDQRRWNYAAYLEFLDHRKSQPRDLLSCIRRTSLTGLRYPEDPLLHERFSLDFARRSISRLHADVLRLYHQDAPQRLSARLKRLDSSIATPARSGTERCRHQGSALEYGRLLETHGTALKRHAPGLQRRYRRRMVMLALRADSPGMALRGAAALLWQRPLAADHWQVLAAAAGLGLRHLWRGRPARVSNAH